VVQTFVVSIGVGRYVLFGSFVKKVERGKITVFRQGLHSEEGLPLATAKQTYSKGGD
jgi:hypothetical protein